MSLRSRKAGLNTPQQIQNTSFRLRKPKRRHINTNANNDRQEVFNDLTSLTFSAENILSNSSNTNIPLMPPFCDNKSVSKNISKNTIDQNQLFDECYNNYSDDEMECERNEFEENSDNEMESESERDEFEENEFIPNEPEQHDDDNKMFTFPGKAGPYFPNYTHFLLFIWVIKHQIGIYTNGNY